MNLPSWLKLLMFGPAKPPITVRRVYRRPETPPESVALAGLLDALDAVAREHDELFDTAVRERLWEALRSRYLELDADYVLPTSFGMFSAKADGRVRAVLNEHLPNLLTSARAVGLDTRAKREAAVNESQILSEPSGYGFDDFFGAP